MPRVPRRSSSSNGTAAAQLNHGLAGTVATVSPELMQLLERHLRARQAGAPTSLYRKTPRAPPGHVRRPENSFIKFRTALYECEQVAGGAQQDLSRRAGVLWHSLPKHSTVRRLCTDLAQADARRHREENPGYKYAPLRPPKSKSKRAGKHVAAGADDDEDYDEHARPARRTRRKRTQRPVPVFTDDEEEDEAALAAGESDVGSVSSATAVGAASDSDSNSERETSLTAQTPPPRSPTAAPHEAVNPKAASSPCTPFFSLDGSCTPRPSGIKTEHESSRLPSTDPLELLGYSWWQPPMLESWGPTTGSVKFEDGGAFEQPLDVSSGPWDIAREDFLLTPSSPSTQMQVDCPSPPVSASTPDSMTVDMMMEQYINWDQD